MPTAQPRSAVARCPPSFKSRLVLVMYYAALAVSIVVALAVVLMCSGSELATILMAATVFALGLVLGKGRIPKDQDVKKQVTAGKVPSRVLRDAPHSAAANVLSRPLKSDPGSPRAPPSHSPSPPPTPPRESTACSDSTMVSSVASAGGTAPAPMDMVSHNRDMCPCASDLTSCSDSTDITSVAAAAPTSQQQQVVSLTAQDEVPMSILSYMFPRRFKVFHARDCSGTVEVEREHGRATLQLVTTQQCDSNNNTSSPYKSMLHAHYWTVSSPALPTWSPQVALEELACFAALSGHQAVLQLQALQSPACTFSAPQSCTSGVEMLGSLKRAAIFDLSPKCFMLLKSEGNAGCGFICSELLSSLFGNTAEARRLVCIEVAVVVPVGAASAGGVFSGVLMRATVPRGQPPIQLTPSMQKVPPPEARSRGTRNSDRRACLLVSGMFPHAAHVAAGRAINPGLNGPPPKSSKPRPIIKQGQTANTAMITRLWSALGVRLETSERYAAEAARSWKRVAHSWVIGVADPTHSLPSHSVFVTGCHVDGRCVSPEFFIARVPCIKPSSGMLLRQLTSKPAAMSAAHWEFLLDLPFGAIIFPDVAKVSEPNPSDFTSQHVSGQQYFVCWDAEVLSELNAAQAVQRSMPDRQAEPDEAQDSADGWAAGSRNEDWLAGAQQLMNDGLRMSEHQALVRVLCELAATAADSSEDFMHDIDSIAFAKAHEEAVDYLKHGKLVQLPRNLLSALPKRLQKHLCG